MLTSNFTNLFYELVNLFTLERYLNMGLFTRANTTRSVRYSSSAQVIYFSKQFNNLVKFGAT